MKTLNKASVSDRIRSILEDSKSRLVSIRFIKKDGSERLLRTNPKQFLETKGTGNRNSDPDLFIVVDHTSGQWRSFRSDSVVSIKSNGRLHCF